MSKSDERHDQDGVELVHQLSHKMLNLMDKEGYDVQTGLTGLTLTLVVSAKAVGIKKEALLKAFETTVDDLYGAGFRDMVN